MTGIRAISFSPTNTIVIPVSDASFQGSREPLVEQSLSGLGGEQLYGGTYGGISGAFSGAARVELLDYMAAMVTPADTWRALRLYDESESYVSVASAVITKASLSLAAGDYGKISFNYIGKSYTLEPGTAIPASTTYDAEIPVFYKTAFESGRTIKSFTVDIDRPYTADDFKLSPDTDSDALKYFSISAYQSGDTKITGTVTLSQGGEFPTSMINGSTGISIALKDKSGTLLKTITIKNAVLTALNIGINGRSLIERTFSWACPSNSTDFKIT